MEARRLRA